MVTTPRSVAAVVGALAFPYLPQPIDVVEII